MTHEVRHASALWMESEDELAHAITLLETAEVIQRNRISQRLDE
ncbi:hypothetical protein SynA1524_01931 [Synechococcus sp. A15-24]|nr:hypothetical protein SynA1524_01931 [Synechococcus sp. A15-24]